eukprot:scaffold641596_cov23-Prasinocladus_malaysianus.AAC.1
MKVFNEHTERSSTVVPDNRSKPIAAMRRYGGSHGIYKSFISTCRQRPQRKMSSGLPGNPPGHRRP